MDHATGKSEVMGTGVLSPEAESSTRQSATPKAGASPDKRLPVPPKAGASRPSLPSASNASMPAPKSQRSKSVPEKLLSQQDVKSVASQQIPNATTQCILPSFSMEMFTIYPWQVPKPRLPKDFFNLSADKRGWKAGVDVAEGEAYVEDGSDDWQEFAGNPVDYDTSTQFYSCIARVFVNRAKRAFRAGRPWNDFASDEYFIDTQSKAMTEQDPSRRKLLLEETLENDVRIEVFEAVAARLCNEIWLQPYPGSSVANAKLKRDSKVASSDDVPLIQEKAAISINTGERKAGLESPRAGREFGVTKSAVAEVADRPLDMDISEDELDSAS